MVFFYFSSEMKMKKKKIVKVFLFYTQHLKMEKKNKAIFLLQMEKKYTKCEAEYSTEFP